MPRSRSSGDWRRYAAPTAFLAVASVAIVLVASALHGDPPSADPTIARVTTTAPRTVAVTTRARTTTTTAGSRRTYTVVAGDTFGAIAAKTDTSVAELERLNPGVSSTSLHVGQKLRIA